MTQTRSVVSEDDLVLESDVGATGQPGDLVFRTSGTERARLKVDGTGTGLFGSSLSVVKFLDDYLAKGDAKTVSDAGTKASSTTLTSATAAFTLADVGKQLSVEGAGAANANSTARLSTTIAAFISSTQVRMAATATSTVSGATAWWGTDDTATMVSAAAAISALGGGTLVLTPGKKYIWDGTTEIAFTSLNGVTVVGDGAKIVTTKRFADQAYTNFLKFTNCLGIKVRGLLFDSGTGSQSNVEHGGVWVQIVDKCERIELENLDANGGLILRCQSTDPFDTTKRARGFKLTNLHGNWLAYGLSFQGTGDDVFGRDLFFENCHRGYFPYGITNHDIIMHSKNSDAADALIQVWASATQAVTQDIKLKVINVDSTTQHLGAPTVDLMFVGPNAGTLRNLDIEIHVERDDTKPYNVAFRLEKVDASGGSFDTVDRGHVLENFTLHGLVKGAGTSGQPALATHSTWGGVATPSADVFNNIKIGKLRLTAQSVVSTVDLTSLADVAVFDQFTANNNVTIVAPASTSARVEYRACDVPNMGTWTQFQRSLRLDPLAGDLGLQSWGGYPSRLSNSVLVSGTIYAMAMPLRKGQVVANIVLSVGVAGSGTVPTSFVVGLCNETTMLAQSGELKASAALTTLAYGLFPLSAAYTVPADGLYFAVVLEVGAFTVTPVQFGNHAATSSVKPNGTKFLLATAGTVQTVLPSNSAAVTLAVTGSPIDLWRAAS